MSPSPSGVLRGVLRVLLPLAVASTAYLYLYPVFHGCAFPLPAAGDPSDDASDAFRATVRQHVGAWGPPGGRPVAPFRLLALGDPQLEGDSSIPTAHRAPFPRLADAVRHLAFRTELPSTRERLRRALHDLVDFAFLDVPDVLASARKQLDLFGNDFYLGHIYTTLRWWARPTHVAVLGDLLGSQWIDDAEFERRSWRYWNRAFRGATRVPDDVAAHPAPEYEVAGRLGVADANASAWTRRLLNVAGNHDVGYAGDLTAERLARFERAFGKAAYELRFELADAPDPPAADDADDDRLAPELRVVVVNNMNLDTPAVAPALQDATYAFVNDVINTATAVEFRGHATVVLAHIPLHKAAGVCADGPHFAFHALDDGAGLREQNQLSAAASRGVLEGIFGLSADAAAPAAGRGRPGVLLTGHDHEGCDVYHYVNQTADAAAAAAAAADDDDHDHDHGWQAVRWPAAAAAGLPGAPGLPGLREITVRSMMGDFGGHAGLLSAWFDERAWAWHFAYADCPLGRPPLWWAVHVGLLVTAALVLAWAGLAAARSAGRPVDRWPAWGKEGLARRPGAASESSSPPDREGAAAREAGGTTEKARLEGTSPPP